MRKSYGEDLAPSAVAEAIVLDPLCPHPDTLCFSEHIFQQGHSSKTSPINNMYLDGGLPLHSQHEGTTHLQLIISFMAVVAGLVFSVAVALLVEEMIFGQVFRIFFTPQPVRVKAGHQR